MTDKSSPPAWAAGGRSRALWERRAGRPLPPSLHGTFRGRRVLALESRRAPELALLIVNYGGQPVVAPALREVALDLNTAAIDCADTVMRGGVDLVVFTTGVGTRLLFDIVDTRQGRGPFIDALSRVRLVARGPKPTAALREVGLTAWLDVPKPHTWREVVGALDAQTEVPSLAGWRVAVQEYGEPSPELPAALAARGAVVTEVPVYRWTLPEDLEPLRVAVSGVLLHEIDVVVLTAPVQLQHLLAVAETMGCRADLRQALGQTVIASIGPMTSEEIRRQGLTVDLEPSNAKMGVLVKEAAERCDRLLHLKRCVEQTG